MEPDKISVGTLVRELTLPQLWTAVAALFGAFAVAFVVGYNVASAIGQVKYERASTIGQVKYERASTIYQVKYENFLMETGILKRDVRQMGEKNQALQETLKTRAEEKKSNEEKMESRVAQLKAQDAVLKALLSALQLMLKKE